MAQQDKLRDRFIQIHAQYISNHLSALDKLKPSIIRQYKLEAEINKIPTKFCDDVMELFQAELTAERNRLLEQVSTDVIGADEHYGPQRFKPARNDLRNEQRWKLNLLINAERRDTE